MSVIQKIQDKYGKVMAIIIGFSLIIFIIMLAFENGGSLFRGNSTTVGKVNGESIDLASFQDNVKLQTQYLQQQRNMSGDMLNQQANEGAWQQSVYKTLLTQEANKLGMQIGSKELNDILFVSNPPQDFRQYFTDPKTGVFNGDQAKKAYNEIKTKGTQEQKDYFASIAENALLQRLAEKYDALLSSSINYPKWMIEKQNAENSLMAKVSFVREPYTSISDSSVKVTENDIQDYINKHKKEFKQEESRSISYVAFNAQPNSTDSASAKEKIMAIKAGFDTTQNVKNFLVSQGVNETYDGYVNGKMIQIPMKDSIFKVGVGHIYGPYIDGSNYVLAKVLASKPVADTVKVRHILIATNTIDQQSGQMVPVRDSSTAKKLADSIAMAIRNGSNFDSLVVKFSDDQGSATQGGVIDNITATARMVPEFNDFIFTNPAGTKGVVQTQFGYHYIEILSQKGSNLGYKIAYISKPIEASPETDMAASNAATKFAGEATNQKKFNEVADKLQREQGIVKAVATDIGPNAYMIQGLGSSRELIKGIYKAGVGEVVQPERIGDFYVVSLVTEVNKEGTMSASNPRVKMMIEPLLINKKKGEIIIKKIGKVSTLEVAATSLQKTVETADSLRFDTRTASALGFEPKVVGAAFNKGNSGKVVPEAIAGTQGVYVLRVDNVQTTPVENANVEDMRKARYMQAKQQTAFQFVQALREAATIKDNRSKFY